MHADDPPAVRKPNWWHALIAGLVHAGLMLLAFPPFSLYGLTFLAPLPLFLIAWRTQRPIRHAMLVLLGATPFYAYHFLYVIDISGAGYVPLAIYLSAYPALFVLVGAKMHKAFPGIAASILLPTIWLGTEVLRGEILFGGFEWYQIGHPLIASTWLASPAHLGGAYLVSLLVAIPGAAISDMASRAPVRRNAGRIAIVIALAIWVTGALTMPKMLEEGDEIRIALIQTNLPQDNKIGWSFEQRRADFAEFVRLTQEAALENPDLIVWPETMFPGIAIDREGARVLERAGLGQLNEFRAALLSLQASLDVPMLVGASRAQNLTVSEEAGRLRFDQDGVFNSVFVLSGARVQQDHYDKLSPTPFGETLPYIKNWPWLQDLVLKIGLGASGMDFGLDAGTDPSPLVVETPAGQIRAATPICFESTQSRVCRRIVTHDSGADMIVLVTNDGWFGDHDYARRMHQLLARWRSLELGVPTARCANTGISSFIDRTGRVTSELSPREDGFLVGTVSLVETPTLYRRVGNLIGWIAFAASCLFVLLAIAMRFRAGRAPDTMKDE